ncbi:hypothetical protein RTM1035_10795 [Roseovarius sp. TM1035]|uniref:SPW repeat protein n=1 Tax=Roseovarius mucosus TaxID=215743 RepID=A0A1V0RKD4_9RHOB|nr:MULTISPECIES: hypothetical protein [Roseovarius]ARE82176.1 hypothetical protein ROSMUCSMR3_00675 [Roseovarius mucosus]AWZ22217.1 Hypothetical protein RAK1035_3510 [Roseovarius sp. AK1035]EDM30490.1 hypothetical protein RTM1035_10795 [Roseovarius sp. TM1035]
MIRQIWQSYRRLPLWVQLWVALILVPVNAASLFFISHPAGAWLATMAVGAMLCNGVLMLIERGFSKVMALPHILIWTPMLGLILWLLTQDITPTYHNYLVILLAVDVFSLILDVIDSRKWLSGDRKIA